MCRRLRPVGETCKDRDEPILGWAEGARKKTKDVKIGRHASRTARGRKRMLRRAAKRSSEPAASSLSGDSRPTLLASGFSFRVGLVALVIVQILLAVAIVTWLSFAAERRAVRELASQLHGEVAFRVQEHLASFLEMPEVINSINTDDAVSGRLDTHDWKGLERYFWRRSQEFKGVGTIGFGSPKGGFVGANAAQSYIVTTGTPGGRVLRRYACDSEGRRGALLLQPADAYDARTRAWYRTALQVGHPTWTDVTESVGRFRLDASAVSPCRDRSGHLLGVFLVDVSLSQIGTFLRQLDIEGSGQAFIFDRSGYLIAASSGERPFRGDKGNGLVVRIHAADSHQPLIREAARRLLPRLDELSNYKEGIRLRLKGNTGYYVVHAQVVTELQKLGGLHWFLVVAVPEAQLVERLQPVTGATIGLLLGVAALVALVGGLTARWFVQPLLRINAAAKSIASGELQPGLSVRRKGELGELAESLSLITDQLSMAFLDLKRANEDLEHHKQQLRSMASEMCLAEEKERRRIASAVHARVIQAMIVAKIKAASVGDLLPQSADRQELEAMQRLVQQAIEEARTLLLELSPPVLYELGLGPAVEWLGERLTKEHGISCTVHQDGQPAPLDLDRQIVLFQATRELLANVVKHSGAKHTTVTLHWSPASVVVAVEDDGVGFDPHTSRAGRPDRQGGFGLFSIRERLHLLGGQIEMDSAPGKGARLTLVVPAVPEEGIE